MDIKKISGHGDMCGGYSYDYEVIFNGSTIEEVLKEIQQFTNSDKRFCKLDKYGSNPTKNCNYWGIYIDNAIYLSSWIGEEDETNCSPYKKFYKGDMTKKVKKVRAYGGWYCAINFNIITE